MTDRPSLKIPVWEPIRYRDFSRHQNNSVVFFDDIVLIFNSEDMDIGEAVGRVRQRGYAKSQVILSGEISASTGAWHFGSDTSIPQLKELLCRSMGNDPDCLHRYRGSEVFVGDHFLGSLGIIVLAPEQGELFLGR